MREEEIKEILMDTIETDKIERVFEGDFLTRDTYFCVEDKDENTFMIIIKGV